MGRIRGEIVVGGQKRWTLFDSGARQSYIVADSAPPSDIKSLSVERTMALGGKSHRVRRVCLVFAEVEGHLLDFAAIMEGVPTEGGSQADPDATLREYFDWRLEGGKLSCL